MAQDSKKTGRPKLELNKKDFENLCAMQCTLGEIAAFFSCSEDTVERRCKTWYKKSFAEVFAQKRQKGYISLRRSQFRLAERNATMAIFLGKQYLGQKDESEVRYTHNTNPYGELTEDELRQLAQEDDESG